MFAGVEVVGEGVVGGEEAGGYALPLGALSGEDEDGVGEGGAGVGEGGPREGGCVGEGA